MAVKVKDAKKRPASSERDASRLRGGDYPWRDLPAIASAREDRYQVAIAQSVMDDIHAHGQSSSDMEVCGVLLGNVYRDAKGPWCFIEASVRGNFAAGRETQVTITSETWTHVNEIRDRQHPDKKFIGWYHTHPGFGIFLSGMDDFIQSNWFSEPWQVALVYDPSSEEEGMFVWRDGKTVSEPFLIVPEDGGAVLRAGSAIGSAESDDKLPSGTLGDLMSRLQVTEQRQRWILASLGIIGLIAIVWPLIVFMFIAGPNVSRSAPSSDSQRSAPTTMPTTAPTTTPSTVPTDVLVFPEKGS